MVISTTDVTTERFTIQAYLIYHNGTDDRYELVDGVLVPMAQGTGRHGDIVELINDAFKAAIQQQQQPWVAKDMRTAIQSPRGTRWETARVPDIVVLPLAQWRSMRDREALITLNEPPPLLVVEVVSPSTIATDYRTKHSEYAVLDIAEYWIVDPLESQVTIGTLEDGAYNDRQFTDNQRLESAVFSAIELTAAQVLMTEMGEVI
jgi:Uma2 family endonuclease